MKKMWIFVVEIVFIFLEQKTNLNQKKVYKNKSFRKVVILVRF